MSGVAYGAQTPISRELGIWLAPTTIVLVRFAFALPFCLIGFHRSERKFTTTKTRLIPIALLFPLAVTLFTTSLFHTTIAVSIFGFYLANLLSALIVGVTLNREPIDAPTIIAFACSLAAAICFVAAEPESTSGIVSFGLLLSVASGLCATAGAQELKRLSRDVDGQSLVLVQVGSGVVCSALAALVTGDHSITQISPTAFALATLYGFLFFAGARLSIFGFKDGPIGLGSVLLSVEVIVGPALAYAFFSEGLSTGQFIGGALTGIAVIATAFRQKATTHVASTEPVTP